MDEIIEFEGFRVGDSVCLRHDFKKSVVMTVVGFNPEIIWPENGFSLSAEPIRKLRWVECQWFNSQRKAERNSFLPAVLIKIDNT
ncbi:MAG TPA: hypothetical protein P5210_16300 [Draconibacterium sp.]|nr:hypothetical protein [Draconibacterium sp.]